MSEMSSEGPAKTGPLHNLESLRSSCAVINEFLSTHRRCWRVPFPKVSFAHGGNAARTVATKRGIGTADPAKVTEGEVKKFLTLLPPQLTIVFGAQAAA